MNPEIFLEWLKYAINKVGPGYFGQVERVYCYELYHFIRVAMYSYERQHGSLGNVFLHAEFVKVVIDDQEATQLGIIPLEGRRSPDFIFHEAATTAHQIAAMEVKANPRLPYEDCIDDLDRLSNLRQNYRFQLVIFHCVNVDIERISQHIERARRDGIQLDAKILVLAKPWFASPLQEAYVSCLGQIT